MILQLKRFRFPHHHRHHHHMSEVNSAYLQAFRSLVSESLNRAIESLKLGSELLSLTWIHRCFKVIPMINKAFAKLMVEIDYPVTSWEDGSIDEYLDYTIRLLDLLNSISCCISQVNHARVSLTHTLSLMERSPALAIKRTKEIKKHDHSDIKFENTGIDVDRNRNEKEQIFHEAMMVMKSTGFWICGVVLLGLTSEVEPIMAITRNMASVDSSLMALDSIFRKILMEEGAIFKEIEGVNESVSLIISIGIDGSDGRMELKRRLDVVRNGLIGLKEEEEGIFGSVMAARNEVLKTLRRKIS